jgi:hypothetical protein
VRRLAVAGTSLLVLLGVAVVATYLLLSASTGDRAARAAPANTAIYLSAYLQPSSGQQAELFALIGKLRGFGDPAAMEQKIDEIAQRLLGDAGIDYLVDVRPWLGGQIALAASPGREGGAPGMLLLAAVRDWTAARAAAPRIFAASGPFTAETFRGREVMTSPSTSYALLDDLLIVATTPEEVHAALEADANLAPSLADSAAFAAAMRELATDRLASLYFDLPRALGLGDGAALGGFATGALAITAAADGLHLDGGAPFRADAASDEARRAYALGARPATLAEWIPLDASAEVTVLGASDSFADLEASLAAEAAFVPAAEALNQLRAVAAIGLGINVDRDLLPLFDGEVALALESVGAASPRGQLLLRPADPVAAAAALDRMRSALADRGSQVSTSQVAGASVTTVAVPQIGTLAYAVLDGVAVIGPRADDVAAALEAHAGGEALAGDDRYGDAFGLAGERAGNEIWADVPGLTDALAGIFDPGTELRDILHQIGELAIRATATDDRLEIHGVLTVH